MSSRPELKRDPKTGLPIENAEEIQKEETQQKLFAFLNPRRPVVEHRHRDEKTGEFLVILERTWNTRKGEPAHANGQRKKPRAEWTKTHKGRLAQLGVSEHKIFAELMASAHDFPHVIRPFETRGRTPSNMSSDGISSVTNRFVDAGLDLDDWFWLLENEANQYNPPARANVFRKPEVWLSFVRAWLRALHEMHRKNMVHCDVKMDNLCIPVCRPDEFDTEGEIIEGYIHLEALTVIDVGLSLSNQADQRGLWRDDQDRPIQGVGAAAHYRSERFTSAVKQAIGGNYQALQALDWRIDLYSMGAELERSLIVPDRLLYKTNTPQKLLDFIFQLPQQLKSYDNDSTDRTQLPHEEIIQEIDDWIGPTNHQKVHFSLKNPYYVKKLGWVTKAWRAVWKKISAALQRLGALAKGISLRKTAGFGLGLALAVWLWFSWVTVSRVVQSSAASIYESAQRGVNSIYQWADVEVFDRAPDEATATLKALTKPYNGKKADLQLKSDKPSYTVGDTIRFTVQSPRDGYLTLFVKSTEPSVHNELVLALQNQPIQANTPTTIPANTQAPWPVRGPAGTAHVVGVVTAQKVNWANADVGADMAPGRGTASNSSAQVVRVDTFSRTTVGLHKLFGCPPAPDTSQPRSPQCNAADAALANYAASEVKTVQVFEAQSVGVRTEPATALPELDGFVLLPGGVARDKTTGLEWMRCSLGQTWDGNTCTGEAKSYTWQGAQDAAKQLNAQGGFAGSTKWRVPTHRELFGLVYCSKGIGMGLAIDLQDGRPKVNDHCLGADYDHPTIKQRVFPNTPPNYAWSSSPYANLSGYAWGVIFANGVVNSDFMNNAFHMRLVRSGQ